VISRLFLGCVAKVFVVARALVLLGCFYVVVRVLCVARVVFVVVRVLLGCSVWLGCCLGVICVC